MSFNEASSPSTPARPSRGRTVSLSVLVVAILVTAGAAVAATGAYALLRPSAPPGAVSVTDDLGRSVAVPFDPGRVVVFGPSIVDSMVRLGLRGHLVGVDCAGPASSGGLSEDYTPQQIADWNLSGSMCVQVYPSIAEEELLNDTPQLVLASTIVSVAALEQISETVHLPVVFLQPPTVSGIEVDISLLGAIFGVTSAAAQVNGELARELGNATAVANQLLDNGSSLPTVLLTYDYYNGYSTYGPGTFGESLMEIASATSIAANATVPYPDLAPEQVLADGPLVIVYATGFGLNLSYYQGQPLWSDFAAVQSGHISGIDSTLVTEPGPTMILVGLPDLLAIFHPGLG